MRRVWQEPGQETMVVMVERKTDSRPVSQVGLSGRGGVAVGGGGMKGWLGTWPGSGAGGYWEGTHAHSPCGGMH